MIGLDFRLICFMDMTYDFLFLWKTHSCAVVKYNMIGKVAMLSLQLPTFSGFIQDLPRVSPEALLLKSLW